MYSNHEMFIWAIYHHSYYTISFHQSPWLDGYTRSVTVITVFCPNSLLDEKDYWNGLFFSRKIKYIRSVDFYSCATMRVNFTLKKKDDLCVLYCLTFLLSVTSTYFKHPAFQSNTHKINLWNNVYSKKTNKLVCWFIFIRWKLLLITLITRLDMMGPSLRALH